MSVCELETQRADKVHKALVRIIGADCLCFFDHSNFGTTTPLIAHLLIHDGVDLERSAQSTADESTNHTTTNQVMAKILCVCIRCVKDREIEGGIQ